MLKHFPSLPYLLPTYPYPRLSPRFQVLNSRHDCDGRLHLRPDPVPDLSTCCSEPTFLQTVSCTLSILLVLVGPKLCCCDHHHCHSNTSSDRVATSHIPFYCLTLNGKVYVLISSLQMRTLKVRKDTRDLCRATQSWTRNPDWSGPKPHSLSGP